MAMPRLYSGIEAKVDGKVACMELAVGMSKQGTGPHIQNNVLALGRSALYASSMYRRHQLA